MRCLQDGVVAALPCELDGGRSREQRAIREIVRFAVAVLRRDARQHAILGGGVDEIGSRVPDHQIARRPRRFARAIERRKERRVIGTVFLANGAVGVEAAVRRQLPEVVGRGRTADDAVIRPVDGHQRAHFVVSLILQHPFARNCYAQAVCDDVHALGAGIFEHRAHEPAQRRHGSGCAVGDAGALGLCSSRSH